mmetsp:Transcript_21847/g.30056  ORF Transcript_21847/g.30056 Transcript_21847/m.30056 type:complete len:310 (-) Transcript_21847:157-1086(-)
MISEIFNVCIQNHASYFESVGNSFFWTSSSKEGSFDLTIKIKTEDMLKATTIAELTTKLATSRGYFISTFIEGCPPFTQNWVRVEDIQSCEISPEHTPTFSVHSLQKCFVSQGEVQLRMIENPSASYIIVFPVLEKFHLVPRYKYKKYEKDPMNLIYLTFSLRIPLKNSEIDHGDYYRAVSVPKICLSLAKEEFPGRYENVLVFKEFYGRQVPMTEVFLALLFRVYDEIYLTKILDLLKPGSVREGAVLVTSVLIRHEEESLADFEGFVRENKNYSTTLWRKAAADQDELVEYVLREEDALESELVLRA